MEERFYTNEDYKLLIEELFKLNHVEIGNFLDFHYGKVYKPNQLNWIMNIRTRLLQFGDEPKNITFYGYAAVEGSNIKLDLAFHWIRNTLNKEVNDVNQKSNKEFFPENLTSSDIPELQEKLKKTNDLLDKDKLKPISELHNDFLKAHKKLVELRIIELTSESKDNDDTDKPFFLNLTHIFALDSGNRTLDIQHYSIAVKCINASYEMRRIKAVASIRELLQANTNHRELIITRLKFGLKTFIKAREEQYSNTEKYGTVETNRVLVGKLNAIEGAKHILNWLENGMRDYVENLQIENVDQPKQFESILEALHFLQRYELIPPPATELSQRIQEALFNRQFGNYLKHELKVETEIRKLDTEEFDVIKNWKQYLNEKTLLDFIKYQTVNGEKALKDYLTKKEGLHGYVKSNRKESIGNKSNMDKKNSFTEIFSVDDWKKYISALEQTKPPLLNKYWEFIGKPKKHKGVICSWIKYLQTTGKIKTSLNRSQLASILNKELTNFNMGKDGKTLDNISNEFEDDFKAQLLKLTN